VIVPRLVAITDTERASVAEWLVQLELTLSHAAPGKVLVMLRDRQLPARARLAFGLELRELTARHSQYLSVNDRLDLAVLCQADAVHLSESSVSVSDARALGRRHGRDFWISSACHDPEAVASSEADGLLLSPIAQPRKGRPALGAAVLTRARAALAASATPRRTALYALGGVEPGNAAELLRAGADGVALIGALLEPGAPQALLESLALARP
jgi:thiamine-phosphate pyrophosphorylase